MSDTLESILNDADEVFRYERDNRPQDRAHAYLARRGVNRGFNDTAMLCVVNDLVRRAHLLGQDGAEPEQQEGSEMAKAPLTKCAGELLLAAEKVGQ